MRLTSIFAAVLVLAGCQTPGSTDPDSIWFKIPPGSRLVLNQSLEIPAGRAHIMVQHGSAATAANEFDVGCSFEVKDLGPRTIQPDTFIITNTVQGREWENRPHNMRFYRIFHLQSATQADILPMKCSYTDDPRFGRPVTVSAIKETLGDIFTLEFPQ